MENTTLTPKPTEATVFSYYPPLHKVANYVKGHLAEQIPLRTAATVAGMEPKYFSAFFLLKTGVGFREWLLSLRIARSKEMMRTRNDSLTNIASAVGFNDFRTFERGFKRHTTMTPRAFKKSVTPRVVNSAVNFTIDAVNFPPSAETLSACP